MAAGGVQVIYLQLRPGNSYSLISWKRMFEVLLQICSLYAGIEADSRVRSWSQGSVLPLCLCHSLLSPL